MQNTELQNTNPAANERGESIAWRRLPGVALLAAIAAASQTSSSTSSPRRSVSYRRMYASPLGMGSRP